MHKGFIIQVIHLKIEEIYIFINIHIPFPSCKIMKICFFWRFSRNFISSIFSNKPNCFEKYHLQDFKFLEL